MPEEGALVCGLGLATADLVQLVDHAPGPNEKVWAREADLTFGGPAANAVATAVRLGCRGRLVASVGRGGLGPLVAAELERAGVRLVDVAADGFEPPVSSVAVTEATGDRAVISVNARWAGASEPFDPAVLDGAAIALVDTHLMGHAHEFAAAAVKAGIPVLMDGGSWKPGGIPYLLSMTDVAVVSEDFIVPDLGAGADPADVLDWLNSHGPRWSAMSRGPKPLVARWSDGRIEEMAVPAVSRVVDTLGAGDVLHGAIAASLARSIRPPAPGQPAGDLSDGIVRRALEQGLTCASESVGHRGVPRR
jgi:sugar/nucleoside kinase (ribokinase family)